MSAASTRLGAAALALVGVPFQLLGRDCRHGCDCVGLVAAALSAVGRDPGALPAYRLRQHDLSDFDAALARAGLVPTAAEQGCGRVLLFRSGPGQLHLGIGVGKHGLVHAHAGLRRSVHEARLPSWPLIAAWMLQEGSD